MPTGIDVNCRQMLYSATQISFGEADRFPLIQSAPLLHIPSEIKWSFLLDVFNHYLSWNSTVNSCSFLTLSDRYNMKAASIEHLVRQSKS